MKVYVQYGPVGHAGVVVPRLVRVESKPELVDARTRNRMLAVGDEHKTRKNAMFRPVYPISNIGRGSLDMLVFRDAIRVNQYRDGLTVKLI